MRARSLRLQRLTRIYTNMRRAYLEANPWCARCGSPATEVHHKAGRDGARLIDDTNWLPVCFDCHTRITREPAEAYEQGWSTRRVGMS